MIIGFARRWALVSGLFGSGLAAYFLKAENVTPEIATVAFGSAILIGAALASPVIALIRGGLVRFLVTLAVLGIPAAYIFGQ